MSSEILVNQQTLPARDNNERYLLLASLISTLGSGVLIIANALIISQIMGTAKAVGFLFILVALPQAFFSLLFGKISDTYDRKKICIVTNILNAVIVISILVGIAFFDDPSMTVYVGSFMLSLTTAMFFPANNAIIKDAITKTRMAIFNSKLEMSTQIGTLTSVAIGGFLIQYSGVNFVFVLNAITFLCSAFLFKLININRQSTTLTDTSSNADADLEKGDVQIRKPWLILLYGIGNIIITVSNMLLVILVTKHYSAGASVLGIVDALAGVGVFVAAALTPVLQKRYSLLSIVIIGYIGNALFIALQPQFNIMWLIVFFPLGALSFGIARISCRTLMFNSISSQYTGRFFGMSNALGLASSVVLIYVIGSLVDTFDVIAGYVALAATVVALTSLASLFVIKGPTK
ncbi:MFS transporter [Pseudomonas huanghezhanensis]|uniref:MFS transporter n=1 Tax=Pseudomonas huanghezhanensis TaxID=3002903 RepID=UPI0022859097|nr:MFS transporter [Pseudomonas sp. BSw22131]